MPSPFPGMDPNLEDPGLWPGVHHRLIAEMQTELNESIRPAYRARIEERVYITEEDDPARKFIIPDLHIIARKFASLRTSSRAAESGVDVAEPVVVTNLIDEEIHEVRLEIIDRENRQVVTVIEVVSPSNKVDGSEARSSYMKKRKEIMSSPVHWVEIDLLRAGLSVVPQEIVLMGDYFVRVSRAEKRPNDLVWPILLTQRLPLIPIPLKPEDDDAPLDLQKVLETSYDRGAYDLEIDYRTEPNPPLPDKYTKWAGELLKEKNLR